MSDYFCNSFETKFVILLLPGSFLKFWDLGALGNCLTRLREGPALGGGLVLMGSRPSRCLCNYNKNIYITCLGFLHAFGCSFLLIAYLLKVC